MRVPWEYLEDGPAGHRVHVVDYDATSRTLYRPAAVSDGDFAEPLDDAAILGDPGFHARAVYGLVMKTLARFEYALGRRVEWGFPAHQLKVIPHAFEEVNAFYSREAQSLLFGYYEGARGPSFMCLSHDIVVHETAHALLDGLRNRFMAPSSPDQAAFHEAFADIVALLSVFALSDVLAQLIARRPTDTQDEPGVVDVDTEPRVIEVEKVSMESLMNSVLLGLADEMDPESGVARVNALRRSVLIRPEANLLDRLEFQEEHRRGEILVAAVMRAFVHVWTSRIHGLGAEQGPTVNLGRVAEDGAAIAEVLLTMAIRALDYTPPIHIEFGDYLSALLTADAEVRADDSRLGLRDKLRHWFGRYGIQPAAGTGDGLWDPSHVQLGRPGVRFGSLQTEPIEMFRLIWANRSQLNLGAAAYTQVESLRPCVRTSPEDGLPLRETVAECTQYVDVQASELGRYGLTKPDTMPEEENVPLRGGSTLILDEYGALKYEIRDPLPDRTPGKKLEAAQRRLDYQWNSGFFEPSSARIAELHRLRFLQDPVRRGDLRDEVW